MRKFQWSDADATFAEEALRLYRHDRIDDAVKTIAAVLRWPVTLQSLENVFRRRGKPTPRSLTRGPRLGDDSDDGGPTPHEGSELGRRYNAAKAAETTRAFETRMVAEGTLAADPAPPPVARQGDAVALGATAGPPPGPPQGPPPGPIVLAVRGDTGATFRALDEFEGPPTEPSAKHVPAPPPPRPRLKSGAFDVAGNPVEAPFAPPAAGPGLDPEAQAVVDAARKAKKGGARSLTDLCDELDLSPRRLRDALERAREAGSPIHVVHNHVAFALREPDEGTMRVVDALGAPSPVVGERYTIGSLSDLHLGSRYCMRAQLRDTVEYLYHERGVRVITSNGDNLDGDYKHGRFEVSHVGLEAQTDDLYETMPQLPGLAYYAIDGNHDDTLSDESGLVAGKYVEMEFRRRGRNDWHHLGRRSAFLRVGGVVINLWHPKGSIGYSTDYKLLKKIESYSPGSKPNILLTGHWHRYCVCESRGVIGIACPTFQAGGSAFGNSLVGNPALGGLALSWQLTAEGTMRRFESERISYFEREQMRDLDGLTHGPREVVEGRVA
jgi:hypothetical protein